MTLTADHESLLWLDTEHFDFNLQFEQLFFSILPSILFVVASLWRSLLQARKPAVVDAWTFQVVKLATITVYTALELALLLLGTIDSVLTTRFFVASSVLKLISGLFMIMLSLVDHRKSPRPSVLLNSYCFLSLLFDAVQARTLFLSSNERPALTYSSLFATALALKVGILLVEAQNKTKWIKWDAEQHSPEETSGIFSLATYFWLNAMLCVGYKKILNLGDLYPLDIALDSTMLQQQFSRKMKYAELLRDQYGLLKALLRTLAVRLILPIPCRLALLAFTFCQPLFIGRLLDTIAQPSFNANYGYGLIGASVLIYGGIALSTALYWYFQHRLRMMVRSILVSEIFRSATGGRISALNDSAALTLMSTDIERIDAGIRFVHEVWANIVQVTFAAWLLYNQLGVVFVAPIGIVLLSFGGLTATMRFAVPSQQSWMAAVQKRVGMTAAAIGNLKGLKMSGLSGAVEELVQRLRVEELAAASQYRTIAVLSAVFGFIPMLASPPLAFGFAQTELDASRLFTSLSYLLLLTQPLAQTFQTVPMILSALACVGRIQVYMERDKHKDFRIVTGSSTPNADLAVVSKAYFGWEADNFVLRDIDIRLSKSSLTIVVGPVGSGKSTLCKALLGEIPHHKGSISLPSTFLPVGFCDQTAFLYSGSVRENIVGFSPWNAARYADVVHVTDLTFDFDALPQGDLSQIGSDGITLSGGQKQRVSLARALYLQSDFLVLDDIFTGLDARTAETVYRRVFSHPDGLLRKRKTTVILCTHSAGYLSSADHILVLGRSTVTEQGTFEHLLSIEDGYVKRLQDRATFDTSQQSVSEHTIPRTREHDGLGTKSVSPIVEEAKVSRKMSEFATYKHYFKAIGLVLSTTSLLSAASYGFFTNFPTIWLYVSVMLSYAVAFVVLMLTSLITRTYWSNDIYLADPAHTWAFYAGIYGLLQACALLSLVLLAFSLEVWSVVRAGLRLHNQALSTLVRAPLRYLTTTDIGVVTNHFSQDLNLVDDELPTALLDVLFTAFSVMGQVAVIATSSAYIAISYPLLAFLLYGLQKVYLRTSTQLRLLDLESKSPLFSHFLGIIKGLATIRAFGFVSDDVQKNARLIQASQRPTYLLFLIQQWLVLVLGLVVMALVGVLTTLAVQFHTNTGFTGASLVTLMGFGQNITYLVVTYTKLETSLGAIARLKDFTEKVEPEDREEETLEPPESWPERGDLELRNVSASYSHSAESLNGFKHTLALRHIDLQIAPGSKVAICGRTGSGKSSLLALLFKFLEPLASTMPDQEKPRIVIDGLLINNIKRSVLRERIIAMPQDPVFLSTYSTFQENLDPLGLGTAKDCEEALQTVGLQDLLKERGGLDSTCNARTLSVGQRQLFSLARAVLRKRVHKLRGAGNASGILLLDEVSSSVDQTTEKVMEEVIRAEFASFTVVAVSHRLEMIMAFDRVIVMDSGSIVEDGVPNLLAKEAASKFGQLVRVERQERTATYHAE